MLTSLAYDMTDLLSYMLFIPLGAECRCRFLSPEEDVPDIDPLTEEEVVDGAFYVFDGACMQQVRERIAKEIELPATGLKRNDSMPNTGPVAAPAQYVEYSEAIEASLQFLQTQWAGAPSTLFNDTLEGNEWKYPGFVNKAAGCPADLGGSFATGGAPCHDYRSLAP